MSPPVVQPPALAFRPLSEVDSAARMATTLAARDEAKRVAREAYKKSLDFVDVGLNFVVDYLDDKLGMDALTPMSSVSTRPPYSASHEAWLYRLRRLKLAWGRIDRPGERDARIAALAGLLRELGELQALAAAYAS